jgi:hypothetical protein
MNKAIIFSLLIMVCALSAMAQTSGKNLPLEIKFGREALGKVPTIEVFFNGKKRLFYFDSGGGISAISPALAKEIGCEPFGEMTAYNAGGMKFSAKRCEDVAMKIGDFAVKRDVAVFDPMQFFPKATTQMVGSIALDAFDGQLVTLDFKGDRLWVEGEKSFKRRIKEMKPLVSRLSREGGGGTLDVFIAAQTPRGRIWLLYDTGNTNKLLFRPSAQEQLGINFKDAVGDKKIKSVKFDMIGLGAIEAEAREREMIYDGMLSYEIIERMVWTIDFRTGKTWAKIIR